MFKITKYFLVFISLALFAEDSTQKLKFNQSIKSFQKQRIAIVIGLNQYKNSEKLKYAIDDSKRMKSILEKVGYYNEIILLNEEEGKKNQKKSPTYENILDVLKEINNKKPFSLLFYYSGHGFENHFIATENTIVLADTKKTNAKNVLSINGIRNYIENVKQFAFIGDIQIPNIKINDSVIEMDKSKRLEKIEKFKEAISEKIDSENLTIPAKVEYKIEHNLSELPESIFKDTNVLLLAASRLIAAKESDEFHSGLFTHFVYKCLSGDVLNSQPEEFVTVPHLVRFTMSNYRAFLKEKQKDNQPIVIVNGGLDFLLSYGRPIGENFAEVRPFQKLDNKTIFAKTIFDSKEKRVKQLFYSIMKSGECNLEELKGISMLTYEDREDSFQTIEYDTNQNIKATYSIQPHKDGWSVNLLYPQESNNPVFTQQIYDYNGNLIKINSSHSEESKKDSQLNQNIYQMKQLNAKGNPIYYENFGVDGKLKNREEGDWKGLARIKIEYDKNGNQIQFESFDENKKAKAVCAGEFAGIAKVKQVFSPSNKLLFMEIFGEDGKRVCFQSGERKGISRVSSVYDNNDNQIYGETLDEKGNLKAPVSGEYKGIAQLISVYDSNRVLVFQETFDEDGKLKEAEAGTLVGIARYKVDFDNRGNISQWQTFGKDGKLKERGDYLYAGIARKVEKYNSSGALVEWETFGSDGKLKAAENGSYAGIAKAIISYDVNNKLVSEETFSADRKPKARTDTFLSGVAKTLYTYPSINMQIIEYFGANGDLTAPASGTYKGIHKRIYLDENENTILEEFYGVDGKLKNKEIGKNSGIARIIQKYDSFGRILFNHFYKESGVIHDIRYHRYYPNPKGKEGKQTLHVEFDSFYRPTAVDFIK